MSEEIKGGEQPQNPKAALDAICNPAPLTMAKVALLERIKSPLLFGDTKDDIANIVATYVISDAVRPGVILKAFSDGTLEEKALDWANGIAAVDFPKRLVAALDSIGAFWKMLPRPENGGGDDGGAGDAGEGGEGVALGKKAPASETASTQS